VYVHGAARCPAEPVACGGGRCDFAVADHKVRHVQR
jgi:hypothetical protein